MSRCGSRCVVVFACLAGFAAIKLLLLVVYGPISMPDSLGYVGYAELLRRSWSWVNYADGEAVISTFRQIGYPALIALFMKIAGPVWPLTLICTQIAASLTASWCLYLCARDTFGLGLWGAGFVAGVHSLSSQITIDQCILTDSVHASLVISAICLVLRRASSPLHVGSALTSGLLVAAAFLIRETMQFLVFVLAIVVLARSYEKASVIRVVILVMLFVAPTLVAVAGCMAWNAYRTGQYFVVTASGIVTTFALAKAADVNRGVLASAPLLGPILDLEEMRRLAPMERTSATIVRLSETHSMPEISSIANREFVRTWIENPVAMLHVMARYTGENAFKILVRPIDAVCENAEWAMGHRVCPELRNVLRDARSGFAAGGMSHAAFLLVMGIARLTSIAIFVALLFAPAAAVRRWADHRARIILGVWACFFGWFGIYGAVHLESRYLAPVTPFAVMVAVLVIRLAYPVAFARHRTTRK